MTKKDWMLLIIPIISNGIFIFIFQTLIKRRFDKIVKIEDREKEIVNTFLQMLQESIEIVSEVEKQFKFREDMQDIIEQFKVNISMMRRYGTNMEFIIKCSDDIEKIWAKSGFCITMLNEYNLLGEIKSYNYPIENQEQIMGYLFEIRTLLKKLIRQTIKI
jgi:hypothetical protein